MKVNYTLAQICDTRTHIYPNAGLPNPLSPSGFDETPPITAAHIASLVKRGVVEYGWWLLEPHQIVSKQSVIGSGLSPRIQVKLLKARPMRDWIHVPFFLTLI